MTFEIPEHIRRAIAMLAAREGITLGEALTRCVTSAVPEVVQQALEAVEAGKPSPTRRGPKPKTKPAGEG